MMYAKNYLQLAEQLANNPDDEAALQPIIATLSPLDQPLLETLAIESEKAGDCLPKTGWAIARIANLAANQQSENLWLQSLSAWYLARAANRWARPNLVHPALHQARNGFKQLNESAWLAACDWQATELAWVRGDVSQAVQKLKKATTTLNETKLRDFAIQSRLSYASTRLYVNEIDEAKADLVHCAEYYSLQEDDFGLAQCALLESVIYRSQNQLEDARKKLNYAIEIFTRLQKIPFLARAYYQIGILLLFTTTDIPQTVYHLEKADELFTQCNLELWHGICQNYLGLTVLQDGQLTKAEHSFEVATAVFQRFHTLGLLANNYNASGLLHLAAGLPQKSLIEFQNAQKLHKRAGENFNASVDTVNLGKTYYNLGRYQDALHTLEKAVETVKGFNNPVVIADCELNIATVWISLHNYPQALEHLKLAEDVYITYKQNASLTTISNLKARVYFEMNDLKNALFCLEESLERSNTFHLHSQAALAHRLIGQLLLRKDDLSSSLEHLQIALHDFTEMKMSLEEAYCRLSLGDYYNANGQLNEASTSYSDTLNHSSNIFDEINWRVYVGLAKIAEKESADQDALRNYQQSIASLSKIRSNFWQAELAGSYASQPSEMFLDAIALAVKLNSTEDILAFIEADKANSFANQLYTPSHLRKDATSIELEKLKNEINWLQAQMRVSTNLQNGLKSALQIRQFRQQLIKKSQEYAKLNSALQRKATSKKRDRYNSNPTLSTIQSEFKRLIGKKWTAIDYYFHEGELFLLFLTPEYSLCLQCKISARANLALESCLHSQQGGLAPEERDLSILGNLLIPVEIRNKIDSSTLLILSPHSKLHGLPWNALLVGDEPRPLVEQAIPVIVPSLRSAIELWKSPTQSQQINRQTGLIVGISEFADKYPALQSVDAELANFNPVLAKNGIILKNEQANWQNLLEIAHSGYKRGLSQFHFLHMASHFFSDSVSGELSGLALWGETLYQDQLRTLAPLPKLVTLSGCSSIFSRTYAGDEHISLPTTCLAAGARSIIGSNWPVPDKFAAEFMKVFYRYYFSGLSPATSLVFTQREFIRSKKDITSWGGYSCIGKG